MIEAVCQSRGAPLRRLDSDFRYVYEPGHVSATETRLPRVQVTTWRRTWPQLQLNLLGQHQAANAAVALACVEILTEAGWHLPEAAVAAGLATVTWPARLEVVGRSPLTILDWRPQCGVRRRGRRNLADNLPSLSACAALCRQ